MKPLQRHAYEPVEDRARDCCEPLAEDETTKPTIVSLSDIHGYLERARSALLTLTDHPEYDPVVTTDADERLHWAGGNHVLVFNGDLVDRGPENEGVLELVSRLAAEAPPGRIRVTLGNHEAIALSAAHFGFSNWYAGSVNQEDRSALLSAICDGLIVAAYEGYNHTYAHAGSPDPYDVETVNEALLAAASDLREAIGTIDDAGRQRAVVEEYDRVLGVGNGHLKGHGAGLVWLDFSHLPETALPQVVGHTRFRQPQEKGNVLCQNVIRNNLDSPGGEGVFVERPARLVALIRQDDHSVSRRVLCA